MFLLKKLQSKPQMLHLGSGMDNNSSCIYLLICRWLSLSDVRQVSHLQEQSCCAIFSVPRWSNTLVTCDNNCYGITGVLSCGVLHMNVHRAVVMGRFTGQNPPKSWRKKLIILKSVFSFYTPENQWWCTAWRPSPYIEPTNEIPGFGPHRTLCNWSDS